jgi:hypothetical protein
MKYLLSFDHLITPSIIKFFFYFGIGFSVLGGLGILASGFTIMQYQFILGIAYIIGALIVILAGVVASRVFSEMVLVLFMIRDELAWQRENRQMPAAAPTE